MQYRSVGNYCAIDCSDLPIKSENAIEILRSVGITICPVDIRKISHNLIGTSRYKLGSRMSEAPGYFDCSSLIKYIYGRLGIWIPRRAIQQRAFTAMPILPGHLHTGDLVFRSSFNNHYDTDPMDGVGHVGLVIGDGVVIHAVNAGVLKTTCDAFTHEQSRYRGAGRIVADIDSVLTFHFCDSHEIETSDDILWILRRYL